MANNNSTSNVQRWFFVAEKPSLMREVQKCYRNHQKDIINKVGSIDFIALAGHVCGSFFPDDYKNHPEWSGKWDEIDYPIIPQQWGIKALDDKRKKETLKKIKSLVSEYDGIIVGTDSDTEGYGIYYLLEHYLKIEKKKALRFIEHSLTDKEIYEQLLCMRDYHTDPVHKHFTESFLIRMRTDWLFGMNVTRLMTNKCGVLMNTGRVKAATTKLIYDNSMAIDQFVSRTYYYLTADYGNFKASQIDKHGKYVEYATADEVKKQSVPLNGKVLKKDVKDEYTNAPQLYDLSAIQVEAGRLYKMSPKEVLATIQSLYETHKVISYPRTQCRYVSSEKAKDSFIQHTRETLLCFCKFCTCLYTFVFQQTLLHQFCSASLYGKVVLGKRDLWLAWITVLGNEIASITSQHVVFDFTLRSRTKGDHFADISKMV